MRTRPFNVAAVWTATLLTATTAVSAAPTPAALMGVHWTLGPYIKGNTDEVRNLVNGPLEQLQAKKASRAKQLDERRAALAHKQSAAAAKLRVSSPSFAQAESDLAVAKQGIETARAGSDVSAKIAAENKFRTAQSAVQRQLDEATASDPTLDDDRKAVAELQQQVTAMDGPINNAAAARKTMLDGLRTGMTLPGPPAVGAKGVLRQLKSVHILDAHSFTADYIAVEVTGEAKGVKVADGMKAIQGRGYRCKLLAQDVPDTAPLKGHSSADVDQTYVVKEVRPGKPVGHTAGIPTLVVTPVPGQPFDALFSVLNDVRSPEELATEGLVGK